MKSPMMRRTTEVSKNENRIIEKLLIYIQLNQIFDKNNINFGGVDMGSKLPEFYKQVRKLIQNDKKIDDDLQINSSELWAFAAGQLIYYLLSQSKSSNKSHAMFEPFLRRFNDANAFKNEILNTYKKYKHEISLNNSRFNQLASKVLEYSINNEDLTKYEAVVYSGYFAKSLLYESQNEN
jgi:CRISPR-associated protein Csh1